MLRAVIKYVILEKCIDILFDKIRLNFSLPVINVDGLSYRYHLTSFTISDAFDDILGECRNVRYSVLYDNGYHQEYSTLFGIPTVEDLMVMSPGKTEHEVLEQAILSSIEFDLEDSDFLDHILRNHGNYKL